MRRLFLLAVLTMAASLPALATVFATVHGVVHDPEHRPIAGAAVIFKAADSEFVLQTTTDAVGEFVLRKAPIGVYRLTVEASGFESASQTIVVASGTNPVLHMIARSGTGDNHCDGEWGNERSRHSNSGDIDYAADDRRNARRGSHDRDGDDYRLRARLVYDA